MTGKDILSHLAARDTSWPEYCLDAIEELISAIQELSQARLPSLESPADDSVTSQVISQPMEPPLQAPALHGNNRRATNSSVISERNLQPGSSSLPEANIQFPTQWPQRYQQQPVLHDNSQRGPGSHLQEPTLDSATSFSVPLDQTQSNLDAIPVEGQESMMWYDQLFASSFSAIDNPLLVAAEFDASVDPTWNYLR